MKYEVKENQVGGALHTFEAEYHDFDVETQMLRFYDNPGGEGRVIFAFALSLVAWVSIAATEQDPYAVPTS